jgi:hypothetical protein
VTCANLDVPTPGKMSDYRLTTEVRSSAEAKDFWTFPLACVQTCSDAHPASYPMDTGGLSLWVKHGRGVTLITHPHLVPGSRKCRSYSPLSLGACMAVAGQLYVLLICTQNCPNHYHRGEVDL